MSSPLSLNRVGALLWGDVLVRSRSVMVTTATLALLILLHHLLTDGFGGDSSILRGWTAMVLFVWGAIEASTAFKEMHDKRLAGLFLMLPASAAEKTLSRLLLVTVVLGAYVLLFMLTMSLICSLASLLFFGEARTPQAILGDSAGYQLLSFVVVQSLFFLGGAWFRRNQLVKTALFLLLLCIGLASLAGFTFSLLYSDLFSGAVEVEFEQFSDAYEGAYHLLAKTVTSLFAIGIPLLCALTAWLRVREVQLSDGI